ncbi:MAG TPA: hypothetical protein VLI06_00275 [Solimonas sp.]|nr:hypothetical protein [Solimonas sp.]
MSEPVLFPFIGTAIEAIAIGALCIALLIHLSSCLLALRTAIDRRRTAKLRAPLP